MAAMGRFLRRMLLAGAALVISTTAQAAPALWRVSDGDSQLWLFGSIHLLDKPRPWRTPQFDATLASADHVYFEVILDEQGYARLSRLSIVYGYSRDGRTLSDYLTPTQLATLAAFLARHDLELSQFEQMRPWLADNSIQQLVAMPGSLETGGSFAAGVEPVIQAEVEPARARAFETVETQFRLIAGGTDAEQVDMLMANIAAVADAPAPLTDLVEAWMRGDVETMDDEVVKALGSEDAPAYRRYLSDRNRRWAETATQLLADNDNAMIIVGAAHLAGPMGLPALLAARGFTVERIDAGSGAAGAVPESKIRRR